jgi:hypothetical protein
MTVASPRLASLARAAPPAPAAAEERCELCSGPLPGEHRHIADVESRTLLCACRACVVLLARPGAGGERFRLVPERVVRLDGFRLAEEQWVSLQLPVELAFFFHSTPAGRVVAFYPSPLGATESQLELEAWETIVRDNPLLRGLEPDVEALLVNRARGARDYLVVPIDRCYQLVALIRARWRGLGGGEEVWGEIAQFFERLHAQARTEAT